MNYTFHTSSQQSLNCDSCENSTLSLSLVSMLPDILLQIRSKHAGLGVQQAIMWKGANDNVLKENLSLMDPSSIRNL